MLHIVSLVPVQQSGNVPRCEANRPWPFIRVLDEVIGCIVAVILDVHRPVEKILCVWLRRLEGMNVEYESKVDVLEDSTVLLR